MSLARWNLLYNDQEDMSLTHFKNKTSVIREQYNDISKCGHLLMKPHGEACLAHSAVWWEPL